MNTIEEYDYREHNWMMTTQRVKFSTRHYGMAAVPESYFKYWADAECKA